MLRQLGAQEVSLGQDSFFPLEYLGISAPKGDTKAKGGHKCGRFLFQNVGTTLVLPIRGGLFHVFYSMSFVGKLYSLKASELWISPGINPLG